MDPVAARRCMTDRTRAILVVHHSGLAADMDAFLDLGRNLCGELMRQADQIGSDNHNAPAAGVSAPASKFTTERARPPVTGKPPLLNSPASVSPGMRQRLAGHQRLKVIQACCPRPAMPGNRP